MTLTEGKYTGRAVRARCGESAKKGTLGCEVVYEIDVTPQVKATKNATIWFTENTAERAAQDLKNIGVNYNPFDKHGVDEFPIKGNDVSITLENETFKTEAGEEKTTLKIKWVNALGGGPSKTFEGSDVKSMKLKTTQLNLTALMAAANATAPAGPKLNSKEEVPF